MMRGGTELGSQDPRTHWVSTVDSGPTKWSVKVLAEDEAYNPPRVGPVVNIQIKVHGLLTAAVRDPESLIRLAVTKGVDIRGVVEILCEERSPLFDPRSCMAVVDGAKVPLSHVLADGDCVDLYLLFGGG